VPDVATVLLSSAGAAVSSIAVAIINYRNQRRGKHDDNVALACAVLLADADDMISQAWWIGSVLRVDRSEQKRESLQAMHQANRNTNEVRLAKGSLQQEKRGRQLLADYEAVIDAFKLYMASVAAAATAEGEQSLDELQSDYDAFHQAVLRLQDTAAGRRLPLASGRMTGLRRSITRRLGRAA
jgi:hypothetical protein